LILKEYYEEIDGMEGVTGSGMAKKVGKGGTQSKQVGEVELRLQSSAQVTVGLAANRGPNEGKRANGNIEDGQ
jgi:hypothetical protein